ncbi:MAG: PAS domain S-box protein [Hyphomicrobiaceae bacterium]
MDGDKVIRPPVMVTQANGDDGQVILGPSDDRLRLALEAAGLGTFRINLVEGYVYYSPELAEMLGVPGLLKASVTAAMRRVHRDDVAHVEALYASAIDPAGSGQLRMEFRFVRPGGDVHWMSWLGRAEFLEDDGKRIPVALLGACADITERKIAEERLRESEERFRALVELSSDWYWEQDENYRFTAISNPIGYRAGSDPRALLGKCRWDIPTLGVTEEQWRQHRQCLEQHLPFRNFEYRRIDDSGRTAWISVNGEPVFDARGRFKGYRGTGQNITAAKDAEQRLRDSEARFQLLADASPALIWVTGPDGAIHFNRPYLEFVGVSDEAVLHGKSWTAYLHPDDRAAYLAASLISAENHTQFEAQARFKRADGVYRWMKSIGLPRFSVSGDFLGHIGSTLDITDLKQHEERIALLVRELDHRVKNILARVDVVIERTADGQTSAPEFANALKRRIASMTRAHDLLSRSHWVGAGMNQVIEAQVAAFATGTNVTISGPELLLNPDAAQALSIVINELATNAAKYGALSAASGRVDISWTVDCHIREKALVSLIWRESGGPPVTVPRTIGYGSTVIQDLPEHELDAKVALVFATEGVVCQIDMPLIAVVADGDHPAHVSSTAALWSQ